MERFAWDLSEVGRVRGEYRHGGLDRGEKKTWASLYSMSSVDWWMFVLLEGFDAGFTSHLGDLLSCSAANISSTVASSFAIGIEIFVDLDIESIISLSIVCC